MRSMIRSGRFVGGAAGRRAAYTDVPTLGLNQHKAIQRTVMLDNFLPTIAIY
jgi:hypothetical protein